LILIILNASQLNIAKITERAFGDIKLERKQQSTWD